MTVCRNRPEALSILSALRCCAETLACLSLSTLPNRLKVCSFGGGPIRPWGIMMLRPVLTIAALMALSAPLGATASSGNVFLTHVVGHLYRRGESFACFSRQYGTAHLAAHPRQQVIFAKALIDAHFLEPWAPRQPAGYMYQVSMAFRFRGREQTLTGVAECGDGKPKDSLRGGAVCAIVGGTTSHLALHGNNVLVMRIPGGADLWAPGPKGKSHDTVKNPIGSDDVELRLARTDLKQCEDLAFDRQKPLRQHEP